MGTVYKITLFISFFLAAYGFILAVSDIIARIERWYHRRKADARIIEQAKAVGVWDKKPLVLGGRALELKAWQDYKIKRKPGESDAHLRFRYALETTEEELENTPREGVNKK